ncbi:ATPase [Trypanosoma cruzi]|nr:ATPase [Trypanosoma cruzi]
MTTALCASPAARMRRGRDERRAEGAVTCGRATRACGAEHTFPSLFLFCFLAARAGRHPQRHTQPHPAAVFFFSFCFLCEDGCLLPLCVIVEVGPYCMYRCHPAVPLTVLMCLPVLLLFLLPHHTPSTQISICTVLCKNVFGNEGRWLTFRAEMMTMPRWPPLTMTVAVFSAHTSLSFCGSYCSSSSVVYGSGSWCLGEGRGAERAEEAASAGLDYDGR